MHHHISVYLVETSILEFKIRIFILCRCGIFQNKENVMNLSTKTIDAFRKAFAQITHDVIVRIPGPPNYGYVHHIHGKAHHLMTHYNNDFADYPLHGQLPTYAYVNNSPQDSSPALRLYMGSQWAYFDIRNVRMRAVEKLQFGDPVITSKSTSKVALKTWINSSDSTEVHDLKETKTGRHRHLNGTEKDFAEKISTKIKEKVGGGIEGIAEAEVETEYGFETAFEQHFSSEDETETTEEKSESTIYHVDPYTQTTILQEEGIADYEQKITTKGILDCSFWFISDSDWAIYVPSMEAFEQWIQGGTLDTSKIHMGDGEQWILKYLTERHFEDYKIDYTPLHVEILETVSFRDTNYGKITRTDVELTPPGDAKSN